MKHTQPDTNSMGVPPSQDKIYWTWCSIPDFKYISYLFLFGYAVFFFVMDISFATNRTTDNDLSEHIYRSLHALEYPLLSDTTTLNDLQLVGFLTPALPGRLASTWEIQNMLGLESKRNVKSGSMFYPTIDTTMYMSGLLLMQHLRNYNIPIQTATEQNKSSCGACKVQQTFTVNNALMDNQTRWYCPMSHEAEAPWLMRTGQSNKTDIAEKYKLYMRYKYNTEHATLCLSNRVSPIVLAHVATNIYTMFASQSTVVLLLYIANVNALFGAIILLYKWHGASVGQKTYSDLTRMNLHGWFSVLFCLVPPLLAIPLLADYFARTEKNNTPSENRAMGSYILGIWTLLFSFLYVSVLPAFSVILNDNPGSQNQKEQNNTLESLAAKKPVITFAYWNLLQAPCFVMFVLSTKAYGVDVYMQFVVFGTIASCVLDVLHARVVIILCVMDDLNPPSTTGSMNKNMRHLLVFIIFVVMHVLVAFGVYVKIIGENISELGIAIVFIILWTQKCQNLVYLIAQFAGWNNAKTDESKSSYNSMLFDIGLYWHIFTTLLAFVFALTINGSSS